MNALTRSARVALPRAQTLGQTRSNSFMTEFKKNWLSDPGAYPVMAIVVFACGFCTYRGTKCLMTNKDVRILPSGRQELIRPQ